MKKNVFITHAFSPTGEEAIFETDLDRFNEDAVYFTEKFFEYAKSTGLEGEAIETIFTVILEAVDSALEWNTGGRKRPLRFDPIKPKGAFVPRTVRVS